MKSCKCISCLSVLLLCFLLSNSSLYAQEVLPPHPDSTSPKQVIKTEYGVNDTIYVKAMLINGEIIGGREIGEVLVWGGNPKDAAKYWANWTRLRNAVYLTYPYARSAGVVMNDVNKHLENISGKSERKKYIKSREKELRSSFTDKVTDLSIYQGKVLMKLINRQTGNNCYEIVHEMKGGFTAGFYQTLMFFAGTSLKQGWNPTDDKFDKQIEDIVLEIDRMYYGAPGYTTTTVRASAGR
ncbi:DUF4294 domain-containing protein [Lacibacter sp. H375]|uniref:DUF4294 domain-containing protein n=1 Tax=Lacibacter sp. H375 TaxID=3133424 RepID=UPI0030C54BDA